jgi:long-chain acyl-CoA synthetase
VTTVRDLLSEIVSCGEGADGAASPLEDPNHYLNDQQREYLKPLSDWQSAFAHNLYRFNLILMRPFKVTAVGYEQLDSGKQFVFVPNHASYVDPFAIAAAIPYDRLRGTQWAGWTGIAFGNPVFSFLSRIARVFPIEAKHSVLASLALAVSVLKAGSSLIWFPEGERTLDGQLLPFKHGIGLLLAKSDVLVVPVYLDGTRQALPPGAFFPHFHPIRVIFGEPIKPEQLAKEGPGQEASERIANALHDRVAALSVV